MQEAVALAQKALGGGEQILLNFANIRPRWTQDDQPRRPRPTMCNLYSITTNQEAIRALFRVVNRYVGNVAPMPTGPECDADRTAKSAKVDEAACG